MFLNIVRLSALLGNQLCDSAAYFTVADLVEKFPGHNTWQTNTPCKNEAIPVAKEHDPDS
jgi:hypothetical protein